MKKAILLFTAVLLFCGTNSFAQSPFFPAGSTWSYLDDGSDQGTAWKEPGFVQTWPTGPTPIGFGDNGDGDATTINKNNCTYLLKTVTVGSYEGLSNLKMNIVHDDGVVVYINGYEAFRSALIPTGDPDCVTELLGYYSPEGEFVSYDVSDLFFIDGDNLIAVLLRNQRESSSDIQFDMEFTGDYTPPTPFFPAGSNWSYLDDGSDQGTAWKDPGFVQTWPTGPTPIGFGGNGDGDATTINKNNCTYLLKTVTVGSYEGLSNLKMNIVHDDGVVVYINGYEAFRSDLVLPGADGENCAIDLTGFYPDEGVFVSYDVSDLFFIDGDNLIAVLLRNQRESSSDIQFDMEFTGDYTPPTSVEDEVADGPVTFALNQNYPNPFNPSTTIEFSVARSGFYSLKVYNLAGQQVADLISDNLSAGSHNIVFEGDNLSSGVYVYKLVGQNVNISRKMLLMK